MRPKKKLLRHSISLYSHLSLLKYQRRFVKSTRNEISNKTFWLEKYTDHRGFQQFIIVHIYSMKTRHIPISIQSYDRSDTKSGFTGVIRSDGWDIEFICDRAKPRYKLPITSAKAAKHIHLDSSVI
ncbi:hypothetical protein K501DRAFT_277462 [Backusella circina FSU 941]|nr:hypothetical protein K501DRAFT_277462 [Backusella circina FSU 941]